MNPSPTRLRSPRPLLAALSLGVPLAAQTPSWSPDWAATGLGGTVLALADFNTELYAGGEWFAAKGGVIRGLARFDGVDWRAVGTGVDLVNYSFPPLDTRVAAMTVFNGELVFTGTFDRVNGQPMNYIARWNGTSFAPLGTGLLLSYDEADVRALAVWNNELYAAGHFDTAGGQPAAGIAKWNGSSWSPLGSGLRLTGGASVGTGRALHVHNGALIAAGEFGLAGNVAANNLARWTGTSWTALGSGSFAPVYALETYGTQLVAAGQFQVGANVVMPGAWNGTAWTGIGTTQPNVPSITLRTWGNDLFIDTGGILARFDGTTWSTAGVISGLFSGTLGESIRALHVHGSELILGGHFTRLGSVPNQPTAASACVAAFDGASTWRPLGTGKGLDRRLQSLVPWRGGWVAAGGFGEAGGVPATGLAFFDGDRWREIGRFSGGSGQPVYDAAVYQGDLIVTGSFTAIDGQPFPGIARFDGTSWSFFGFVAPIYLHAHGSELYGYGNTTLQRWNGSLFVTVATPPSGGVDALHSHSDGQLYVANNDAFNHRVLRWNGTQLQSIGTANDFVQALGSRGSELVAGGRFTSVGGAPAALIARWNGSTWSAMPAPVSGYAAYAFCELDGDFYAGVSGDPRGMTLRLRNGAWSGLGSGTLGVPVSLWPDPAIGSVIGSGDIQDAGGLPSRSVAEWRTQPDWRNRLHGLGGNAGEPLLRGRGNAQGGATLDWTIAGPASTLGVFVLGLGRSDLPVLGGTLVPQPDALLAFATDALGAAPFALALPPTLAPGTTIFSQTWLLDASGPQGLTATNALQVTTH